MKRIVKHCIGISLLCFMAGKVISDELQKEASPWSTLKKSEFLGKTFNMHAMLTQRDRDYAREVLHDAKKRGNGGLVRRTEESLVEIDKFDERFARLRSQDKKFLLDYAKDIYWFDAQQNENGSFISAIYGGRPNLQMLYPGELVDTNGFLEHLRDLEDLESLFLSEVKKVDNLKLPASVRHFSPPGDFTDDELSSMNGLAKFTHLSVAHCKNIDGSFIFKLDETCGLQFLEARSSVIQTRHVAKLLGIKSFLGLYLLDGNYQVALLTRDELATAIKNGNLESRLKFGKSPSRDK